MSLFSNILVVVIILAVLVVVENRFRVVTDKVNAG
jgi:hypothetical protein